MALMLDIDPITGLPRRGSPFFLSPDEQQGPEPGQAAPFPAPSAQLAPFSAPTPPVEPPPPPDVVDPQMRRAAQLPENQPPIRQPWSPGYGDQDYSQLNAPLPPPVSMPSSYVDPRLDRQAAQTGVAPLTPPPNLGDTDFADKQRSLRYESQDDYDLGEPTPGGDARMHTGGGEAGSQENLMVTPRPLSVPPTHRVGKLAGMAAPPPDTSPDALRQIARTVAVAEGLDPDIFERLVNQESGFNPKAGSPAGAQGLTQLMPATARSLGVTDPFDPVQNLKGGARYLKQQLDRYGGDYRLALAAYNAGPGAVDKYGGVPLYEETQRYVKSILGTGTGTGTGTGEGTKLRVMQAAVPPAGVEPTGGGTNPPDTTPDTSPEGVMPAIFGSETGQVPLTPDAAKLAVEHLLGIPGALGNAVGALPIPFTGQTIGQTSTNITKGIVEPFLGYEDYLSRHNAALESGDFAEAQRLRDLMRQEVGGGKDLRQFLAEQREQSPVPQQALGLTEFLMDPGNLAFVGATERAPAAARALRGAAEQYGPQVLERLGGIDPATGLRYAEQGGLRLGDTFSTRQAQVNRQVAQLQKQLASESDPDQMDAILKQIETLSTQNDALTKIGDQATEARQQIQGVQEAIKADPVRAVWQQLQVGGEIPESLTVAQYLKFNTNRTAPPANSVTAGRIPVWRALDDKAKTLGFDDPEQLVAALEQHTRLQRKVVELRNELKALDEDAALATAPAPAGGLAGEQTDLLGGTKPIFRGDTGQQGSLGIGAGERGLPEGGRQLTPAEETAVNGGVLSPETGQGVLPTEGAAPVAPAPEVGPPATPVPVDPAALRQRIVDAYGEQGVDAESSTFKSLDRMAEKAGVTREELQVSGVVEPTADGSGWRLAQDAGILPDDTPEVATLKVKGAETAPSTTEGIPLDEGGQAPPQPPHTSGPGNAGGGRWQPPSGDEPGQAMPPATPEDNVVGLRPINSGITAWDRLLNRIKRVLGEKYVGAQADEDATPAFRERARVQPNIDSQARVFAAEGSSKVRAAFKVDAQGRITALADDALGFPKGPTLQDLAARRPLFEDRLTPEQVATLDWLRDKSAPYKKLWDELGLKDPGSRPDVMENGFYLPRGRADKEGAEEAMKVFAGPTRRGKAGFEKSAVFDSMAQGIDEGYQYAPLHDVLYSYVKEAGTRIADQHVANYFSGLTDDAGQLLHSTAADRVDPVLRDMVQTLRAKIYAQRMTLTRQNMRERMAGMSADQAERFAARQNDLMEKAQARFEQRLAGKNTDEYLSAATAELRVLEREERRDARLAARAEGRAQGAGMTAEQIRQAKESGTLYLGKNEKATAGEILSAADREHQVLMTEATRDEGLAADAAARRDAAKQKYDELVAKNAPDAQTKVAQREFTIMEREAAKAQTRADLSRAKADAFTVKRGATETSLRQLQTDLDSLSGRWKVAQERAAQTPRDMATIDLRGLEGKAFPLSLANAANSWLAAEKPLSGAGAAVYRGLETFNHLLRSLGSTYDNSALMVQGLLGMAKDKAAFGMALKINLQSWLNGGEHVLGAYLTDFDKRAALKGGLPTASDWARAGGHVGGEVSEFSIPRGGEGTLGPTISKLPVLGGVTRAVGDVAARADRAFGYFGDALRLEIMQHEFEINMLRNKMTVADMKASGEMEAIARGVNDATGYHANHIGGSLGDMALFAPGYFQSRLTTAARAIAGTAQGAAHVATLGAAQGASREKVIARTAIAYLIGQGVALTYLTNAMRGYDTDWNPVRQNEKGEWGRNPNFMRIRNVAGNDISVFGPWDSLVGMIAQAGSGVANRDIGQVLSAGRTVVSPLLGKTWDSISGSDLMGNKVRDTAGHLAGWIASSFLPFQVQNLPETAKEVGTALGDQSLPEVGGALAIGAFQLAGGKASPQSYGDFREQISQSRFKLPYSQLDQDQRRIVRAELDALAQQGAYQPSPPPDTGTPQQQAAFAFQRHTEVEADLEKGLRAKIDAGMMGPELNKTIQQFMQNRWRASQDLLDVPAVKESLRRDNKPLKDLLAEQYWAIEPPEDPRTGKLDFQKQQADRLNVLSEAQANGVPLNYITGTGQGTFRGTRFTDPVVRQMVEQREAAMQTLAPYFNVDDDLRKTAPYFDAIMKRIEALPPNDPMVTALKQTDTYRTFEQAIQARRNILRARDRAVEQAGETWLGWRPLGSGRSASSGFPNAPSPAAPRVPAGAR